MSLVNAVNRENVNATRKLLNNGANVNQNNGNGRSPLMQASFIGNSELVKLLLAKGADVNKADSDGNTALHFATVENYLGITRLLLAAPGIQVNKVNKDGETPLIVASQAGDYEIVEALLAKGADVNKADKEGRTPLNRASSEGHMKVVKVLLGARGIDVNKADKYGLTALHRASMEGFWVVTRLLLSAPGIQVNKENIAGSTPLYLASYYGRTRVVKVLLTARGIDVNKATEEGNTPLHAASEEAETDIVKLLLAKGADVNKADERGRTPLYVATRYGRVSEVRELLKSKKVQVDKASSLGWTPLMIASQFGAPICARELLKAGANVNKTKPDGVTALHIAAFNNQEDVVKELLAAKNIDLFKKNDDGNTALDDAKSEAVKKLLRKAMGIATPWRNMNNEQRRGMKPILLKRMIAKGLKNGKNATFTEPIIYANYSYRTLKPVNNKNKNITSFGLVIDDKNNVKAILDLEGARRAMRLVRERANRENKTVEQPLPGIIFKNWSLVNFTPNEYFNAMKDLQKLSAIRKGKRTRNNLKSGNMNRIEANQRKTARIANLRSTIRKSRRELNNLM